MIDILDDRTWSRARNASSERESATMEIVRENGWWHRFFLGMAEYVATASKDPSTKVGAAIVDVQRRVIGLGYNGFPRGIADSHDRLNDRLTKYKLVVHAEVNAILNAIRPPVGATLYCTLFPCNECAKVIIQAGIARLIAPKPEPGRWDEAHKIAEGMLSEAGVKIILLESLP